ncbi:MAG: metal-sensing transcriptional repressor [Oscillospiraceae bacterium]|nr:metal-sensing transcriptional repressor [Oscillospiraceae bacterium]
MENCCSGKTKERSEAEIKFLMNRLSRIEGQIRGIRGMVERGAYCADILTQSSAVSAAMNAFNRELLASHVRTCVVDDVKAGRDETVDELVGLIEKLMR